VRVSPDRFVPAAVRADPERHRCARLVVNASLLTCGFAVAYAAISAFISFSVGVATMAATAGGFLVLPFLVRSGLPTQAAGHVYMALCAISVGVCAHFSGGLHSPVLPWFVILPFGAMLLLGPGGGVAWLTFSVAAVIGYTALEGTPLVPPSGIDSRFDATFIYLCYVGLVLIVFGIALVFERARAQAESSLAARNADLARTLEHLTHTQAQLVQQEKLASLGALTAGIAHEIKNPLNFVNNFAALTEELVSEIKTERAEKPDLRVSEVEDLLDDLQSNAARIREHGQRADSIVKNMLAHSRGTSGVKEAVDINGLLDEYTSLAYSGMRAQRSEFTCTIERAFEVSPPTVQAVPQDLSRVFLNLLSNAFYAVARRREEHEKGYEPLVRVETRRAGDVVEVAVWDNGGGIPEEIRSKIFEPFFTTKPTGEGTGLGLSLSHDIVAAHGGSLSLESEEGTWTCFTVRLPTAQMETETT